MFWPFFDDVYMKKDPFIFFMYYCAYSVDTYRYRSHFVPIRNFSAKSLPSLSKLWFHESSISKLLRLLTSYTKKTAEAPL